MCNKRGYSNMQGVQWYTGCTIVYRVYSCIQGVQCYTKGYSSLQGVQWYVGCIYNVCMNTLFQNGCNFACKFALNASF